MAVTVGAVYVDVLPTTREFVKRMVAEILPEADKAGERIGEKVGEALGRAAGRKAREGIEEGVEEADTEAEAAKKGKKSGGSFARTFKAEVEAALRSLPDIDIDADPEGALADIAIIREQLRELSKQEIGVDLDAEGALRSITEIRAQLEEITDRTVDVDFDVRDAMSSLGQLESRIRRSFQDSQGSFARSLRGAIDNAVRALPDIKVNADTSDIERDLATVRELLADLGDKRIDIDISTPQLLAELASIEAMLATLEGQPHTVRVQADIDAARAALSRFTQDAGEEGRRSGGAFMQRMRDEVAKVAQSLPDIQIGADTSRALAMVGRLRSQLATLSMQIGVDLDAGTALERLGALRAIAEQLDRDDIDIDVRVDLRGAIAQLAALAAATEVAEEALDGAVGNGAVGKISRFRLILGAVAALLPLIAGAILALPAAIALLIGPALAVAAGVDGIKKAFQELKPEIDEIQRVTSQAFEQGLEPTIARLHDALPQLQDELVETALAVTYIANRIAQVATESENLGIVEENFDLVNAVIRSMGPSLDLLTENMIRLTNIGLSGMVGFGEELRQVGQAWADVITRLQASGAAEAAVRALFQVLAELLNLAAGMTEFGAVLAGAFGPALATAISGLAAIFSGFAQAIDSLSEPMRTVVASATTVGLVMLVLGTRVAAAALAMRTGLVSASAAVSAAFTAAYARTVAFGAGITGLGVASRVAAPLVGALAASVRTLWVAVGGPIGAAITAIVIALSFLGQGQSDAAAATDEHKVATQELSDALKESGGVITSNIRLMTAQRIEAAGLGDALSTAGISMAEVTSAVSQGGPVYDNMIARLQALAAENVNVGRVATETGLAKLEQKEAAQQLLDTLAPMRQSFVDAANQNRALAEALMLTGNSMVGGIDAATALEEAYTTLSDEMSTVDERAKALYQSLILLSGQALPLGLAQGALGQATRDLAEAFKAYEESAKAGGDTLLDTTGKFNVASEAGFKLTQEVQGLVEAMANSATSAFEAAGGMNNVELASAAAAREAQFARDSFIKMVGQFGITGQAAEELADRYGLIPSLVVTQLRADGIPAVAQDILQINQLLRGIPPNTMVNIGVPTQQTIAQLQAIGAEIVSLPEGEFGITLRDEAARLRFQQLVNSIEHPPTPPALPTTLNPAPANQAHAGLVEGINSAPPAQAPVGINPVPAQTQLPGLIGEITGAPPAGLPTELNSVAVPPQVGAIQQQVTGTVAAMPVNPIKGSGWDAALLAIRDSVVLTVAAMPIDAAKSLNFDAQLAYIRSTVPLGPPALMPIDVVKAPSFDANLGMIKGELHLPPYATLFIDVARAPTWAASLALITGPLTLPPYSMIFIDVARAPTWAMSMAAITGPLMLPPYTALLLTVAKALDFDIQLNAIRQSIILTPLVIPLAIDPAPAIDQLNQLFLGIQQTIVAFIVAADVNPAIEIVIALLEAIQQTVTFFTVIADTAPAQNAMIEIINWIQSLVVPFTVIAQFGGFGGMGMASGGVVSSGQSDFDAASAASQRLGGGSSFPSNGGGGGNGGGMFNPGADLDWSNIDDLRNRFGNIVMAMADGGAVGSSMAGGIAAVVPPNTWRVIGDRVRDDEAYIPINGAARSHSILAYTAQRMGYHLSPQASGSYMTQQSGAFNGQTTWASGDDSSEPGSQWSGGGGAPLIGQVVASPSATAADLADEVMFRLRHSAHGGVHRAR